MDFYLQTHGLLDQGEQARCRGRRCLLSRPAPRSLRAMIAETCGYRRSGSGAGGRVAQQVVRDGQGFGLEVQCGEAGRQLSARRLVLHAAAQPEQQRRE